MIGSTIDRRISRRGAVLGGAVAAVGVATGLSPFASSLAFASASPRGAHEIAYVCNALDDTVTVIDAATLKVIDSIRMNWGTKRSVPRWPFALGDVMVANAPMNAAFTPDRSSVWIPNAKGRNIAVVDARTNEVVRKIILPMDPCDVTFTPDGSKAVATLIGDSFFTQGGVIIIDVATGNLSPVILTGTQPEQLAITPDGKRVYNISKSMWVVDIEKAVVECEVYLPYRCYDVIVSPDGKRVYTGATFGGDKLVIVDNAPSVWNVKVVGTLDVNNPCNMAFSRDGRLMYISSNSKSTIQIVDLALGLTVMTATVPAMPSVMALTQDGSQMFLAHNIGDSVSVLDARTLAVLTRIKCGDQPNSVAVGLV